MKTIVCTSDLHSHLPPIPKCDLLLIAGDICPDFENPLGQIKWLNTSFRQWLLDIPAKHVVGTPGNHDRSFEELPHLIPQDLRWTLLQHNMVELEGFKIFGMPWIRPIWGAFQESEEVLQHKYAQIPEGMDIIISHGPPYGICDLAAPRWTDEEKWPEGENCGSKALRERIFQLKPRLFVCGHIHESFGIHEEEGVRFVNAALCNRSCQPTNYPYVLEL
jgi:Icc-related predicted phosphoesterase